MNNLFNHIHGFRAGLAAGGRKCALALILLAGGLQSEARALESPRGKERFGNDRAMAVSSVAPAPRTIRIVWSFPVSLETPDLVFKLYHSTNLALPLRQWRLLTNIPGYVREVPIAAGQLQEFFVLTASNYLGESAYATP